MGSVQNFAHFRKAAVGGVSGPLPLLEQADNNSWYPGHFFLGLVRFGVVLQRMVIDEYARLCGLVVFGTFFAIACLRIPHFFVGGDGYEVMCCGFVWHVVMIHGAIV